MAPFNYRHALELSAKALGSLFLESARFDKGGALPDELPRLENRLQSFHSLAEMSGILTYIPTLFRQALSPEIAATYQAFHELDPDGHAMLA